MRVTRIVACVSLMLIVPATARATWWDWIQEMSGPGPFTGRGSVLVTVCSKDGSTFIANDRPVATNRGDKKPCWFFDLRQLAYDPKDGNFPAAVNLTAHDFGATWQLLRYRSVEIGVGAGIAHFSGVDDVTANRFTVTVPRVVVTPVGLALAAFRNPAAANRFSRLLKFHYGYIWIPGSVQAENFGVARGNGPGQSTFGPTKGEFLRSRGFFIDFGELFRRP